MDPSQEYDCLKEENEKLKAELERVRGLKELYFRRWYDLKKQLKEMKQ